MSAPAYDVVIPTIGRPSLQATLASLQKAGCRAGQVVVIEDTTRDGPAAARNRGVAETDAPWVVFLDDDVVVDEGWADALHRDLTAVDDDVAAVQGRIVVPRPEGRALTDWERSTTRLESAVWITADMAVRRAALEQIGGFDERFPRAYREDTDLALRLVAAGWRLVQGSRVTHHPVRPAGFFASVRAQAGNADDALVAALHGPTFREAVGEPRSIMGRHVVTTAALALMLVGTAARRWSVVRWAAVTWLALTSSFATVRIAPGPRTPREVTCMVVTSALIPPEACRQRARGWWRVRRLGEAA